MAADPNWHSLIPAAQLPEVLSNPKLCKQDGLQEVGMQ